MHIVMMGVSGSGKSTIGRLVAAELGCGFIEGDGLHPPANIAKMSAGVPLDDADRRPWLELVRERLAEVGREEGDSVVACSALRKMYRDTLRAAGDVVFVHLEAAPERIQHRLEQRSDHFMPAALLGSQLAAMEPLDSTETGFTVSTVGAPIEVAARILVMLRELPGPTGRS
ncbi:gluconokinase [Salinibacterium hongtaonis]|uniref:gluconokinase n=1 Tax=Homoserinimonas hongtaonis TaxID=2079791 RepID=UPI000D378471|nr:gluconokinase [Salinibacterium hongtaonis]AWB89802.1 hypothetical protein C2138_09880 [Salinibacterium hongtaonis]